MINKCKNCSSMITSKINKFCNQSCSAKYNNSKRPRRSKASRMKTSMALKGRPSTRKDRRPFYNCVNCGRETNATTVSNTCSKICWMEDNRKNKTARENYARDCRFKFNVYDYPNWFNLKLVEKYGWYSAANKGNNLGGVSRDHKISISYGFNNNISASMIAHPANCELMIHGDNNSKNTLCSITRNELVEEIEKFKMKTNNKLFLRKDYACVGNN